MAGWPGSPPGKNLLVTSGIINTKVPPSWMPRDRPGWHLKGPLPVGEGSTPPPIKVLGGLLGFNRICSPARQKRLDVHAASPTWSVSATTPSSLVTFCPHPTRSRAPVPCGWEAWKLGRGCSTPFFLILLRRRQECLYYQPPPTPSGKRNGWPWLVLQGQTRRQRKEEEAEEKDGKEQRRRAAVPLQLQAT